MAGTALTIEKEIEDARGIRATDAGEKREDQPSSSSRRGRRLLLHMSFRTRARMGQLVRQGIRYVISADSLGM